MQILSHRGYWKTKDERNTLAAMERSFELGFGVETDIRDWNGKLAISHDPVEFIDIPGHNTNNQPVLTLETFLASYTRLGSGLPLALNIKADGLQSKLREALAAFGITNYFVFDMSVPDTLGYIKQRMPFYTRQSEYELDPALYEQAAGVWMDMFEGDWIMAGNIKTHLTAGKRVCLVSPELHQRPHEEFWEHLRVFDVHKLRGVMLCTDFPEEAKRFFNDED